jgi:hypothetical protein
MQPPREPTDADMELWQRLVALHSTYVRARYEFLTGPVDRVTVLDVALRRGDERNLAMGLAPLLAAEERQWLFSRFVVLASWFGALYPAAAKAIEALPRDWVLERIEAEAEPLLAVGNDEEYRAFISLYNRLDPALARKLALRAAAHEDPDIREAGEVYLEFHALERDSSD